MERVGEDGANSISVVDEIMGTPLPPIYWNHQVARKTRFDLRDTITYGQNLEPQGFARAELLFPTGSLDEASIEHFDCGTQGQMSHWLCGKEWG
jgi:hypothetical protein